MNERNCPPTHELVQALRDDALGRDVENHVGACAECAEVVHVARRLRAASRAPEPVPSFASLRWSIRARAILEGSRRRNRRATAPLRIFHLVVGLVLIAATLFTFVAQIFDPGLTPVAPLPVLVAAAMGIHMVVTGKDRMTSG